MSVPSQVQNLVAQQADGNILLTWNASLGSTSYTVQRSTDGLNFTTIASSNSTSYTDPYPGVGIQFFYQVISVNGSGNGVASTIISMVAAPPGEMSLAELRLRSQQTADRVNSGFVKAAEWNSMINLACFELYDILVTAYEDIFLAQPFYINTNSINQFYDLPDGLNYKGGVFGGSAGSPLPAFYKLSGMDLGVNTSNNAWVTLNKFNFSDRNSYVYPNSTSTIYGVYNMRYRIMGTQVEFIPIPAGNQQVRGWYIPRLKSLLADNDVTTIGFSGWLRYVIVRAAIYALTKEQVTDTTTLQEELIFLKTRIEQASQNRDQANTDTVSNTRRDGVYGGGSFCGDGANGGW